MYDCMMSRNDCRSPWKPSKIAQQPVGSRSLPGSYAALEEVTYYGATVFGECGLSPAHSLILSTLIDCERTTRILWERSGIRYVLLWFLQQSDTTTFLQVASNCHGRHAGPEGSADPDPPQDHFPSLWRVLLIQHGKLLRG